MMISNMAAGQIAIQFGAKGFNECVVTACATSANALVMLSKLSRGRRGCYNYRRIGSSHNTVVFCRFLLDESHDHNGRSCFGLQTVRCERNGFVMGEGAAILVLEELEHALKRGANILAEIVGYGVTNDAYHITAPAPEGEGAARCMKMAIDDAGIKPEDIDYINAHGTSTEYNDKFETAAIKTVFGEHARKLAVSSTKSMTGHLLGAAGAIEAIITVLSIKDGFLPPTINYRTPDLNVTLIMFRIKEEAPT